jgi:hypothetical protein
VDSEDLSSPMRSLAESHSGFAGSCRLRARHLAGSFPGACCACLRWSQSVCITGGSAEVRCSWCCTMKTSLGSPWSAAQALPRHAVQACAWASGECLPLPLKPSFLRPWSLAS